MQPQVKFAILGSLLVFAIIWVIAGFFGPATILGQVAIPPEQENLSCAQGCSATCPPVESKCPEGLVQCGLKRCVPPSACFLKDCAPLHVQCC